ncbi:GGDEF domain-containing protein [Paenibacillus sp. 2RAB27]
MWIISSMHENIELDTFINERLSLLYKLPFQYEDIQIAISFSSGVSMYPRDATDITTLMKKADEAMYKMKHSKSTVK